MSKLPHVTWLRAFEAAARHSSFSGAAEELNLTPAAVSQHIRLLERHLGVELFKRLPHGVTLTDMGQAYALPIRKAFTDMRDATSGLFSRRRKRHLHIRTSVTYGELVLAPHIADFSALHPDIELRFTTAVWSDRLDDPSIDIDIRYGTGDWPDPNMTQLSQETGIVVCTAEHAARFGSPPDIAAMAADRLVLVMGSEVEWQRMSALHRLDLDVPAHVSKADSSILALQMLLGGGAAAIIHESFARAYLEQGLLVSPFAYQLPIREAYFMIIGNQALNRSEVTDFRDWLIGTQITAGGLTAAP
ncbi:LysR family glycine cleavage system transcriptional activator [Rubricella aquisinus]|uniref:LysR family glycine cleavage system transcriptional activator n=1 Tax=Rubricella aquisinus TaxID=2028108 RepID=A0A840WNW6_9RHOB|nr:LysR substrate-binding domain-containing protein [Rubricella aquisinus]MBB5516749.1 LysR family glycine cleavage system transcriptional activator [Rubricella aquisinus]